MATATLQTSSERVEKDRVKLRVEVPEEALRPAVDAVYRRWAREIRIPGFRKGKVPRQLIDARVGAGAVREEAVRDALPDLSSVSVEAPSDEVTEADVDEQLERLRDRFAELETVGREARRGDFVLIDIKGYRNEQTVDEASSLDFLYEVGSRSGPPKLDDELQGSRPGAILRFHDEVAVTPEGSEPQPMELSFTVLVKEVKAKKLPPLDDDFAKTVGEFSSLEALRDDLRSRLADIKRQIATDELRALVLQRLVDATQLDPPAKLVDAEFDHQLEHFHDDLRQAGLTLETYARETQSTELEVRSEMRKRAARSVKAELILEEVARRFDINVEEEEIGREIALAAARAEQDPGEVAKRLVETGRVSALAADIMRRKALDHVVESADCGGAGA